MSFFPDLGTVSMVAAGDHVRAIGWLHPDHPYNKGKVSEAFLARLRQFVEQSGESADALFFGAFGGIHTCEFCGWAHGSANFGVPDGDILFVAPEMVVHYIQEHEYCPPDVFVNAVMSCPLPEAEDYQLFTEPFWQMHRQAAERRHQERIEDAAQSAAEHGGSEEAVREASARIFGHSMPEMCERIRRCMPCPEPGTAADRPRE